MEARREDVESIEGIVKAMYEVISGPAGERDWARERTLLHPSAPAAAHTKGGRALESSTCFDCEGYIASRSAFFAANDFHEGRDRPPGGALRQHRPRVEHVRRAAVRGRSPFLRGIDTAFSSSTTATAGG